MPPAGEDAGDKFEDTRLKFRPARWPKIEFHPDIKEDLIRSFNLFDTMGVGVVSIDALKVALRALGHDIDAKEKEAIDQMFPDGTVVFGEYLNLLSQWILNIDNDLDVKKAFSLFDVDGKGFIDLNDLRRVRDSLGYSNEIDDSELVDMLTGSQVNDAKQELKELYEARQDKTRQRKGQGYATQVDVNPGIAGLPPGSIVRKTSSKVEIEPEAMTVDFDKFKRVLQLEAPPPEPI
uniref:Centrin n=1 Tax=Mesocestoides corti TaxID=53468 RepID=A0A5K3EF52_MESCO